MENQTTQKWYQKPLTVILFLIFFFPIGLYLIWKNQLWSKTARILVSVFFGLLVLGNINKGNNKPPLGEYSSFGHNIDIHCGSSNYIKLNENNKLEFYTKVDGEGFPSCVTEGTFTIEDDNSLIIQGLENPNAMGLDKQFNGKYIWTKDQFDIPCFKKIDNNIVLTNYGKK